MKAKVISYLEKDHWNNFVASMPGGSVLQTYEWGEFKSAFGWQPIRLMLEEDEKIVAGISILKREIPFINHCFFYAPRGPVLDFGRKELLQELLETVEKEADRQHAISLKIDPEILEEESNVLANLRSLGFEKALKEVQPRATFVLDLNRSLEEILMGFEEKTRYNVRLAEKKGVEVKEEASEKGVRLFYGLYLETARRDKFLIHPLIYYQKLQQILFPAGMGTVFLAYYQGKPIAGVIIFTLGEKAWYMYGASASEFRNVMPNHLLHWEVIKWAKARGIKQYDLWGIPACPTESHPLYGVYRFKKGFRGKLVKYLGAYNFPYSPLFYHVLEYGIAWWQNLRSLLTKGKIEDSLGE